MLALAIPPVTDFWVQVLAGACVAAYAWERFQTPPTWRSTTTRLRWRLALSGYVGAAVGLWWILMLVIANNPQTASFLLFGASENAAQIVRLSAPFAAALLLTAVLPNAPVLRRIDAAMQTIFRELGAIPKKARDLSFAMRRAGFTLPPDLEDSVRAELTQQGLDADHVLSAPARSPAWEWVRVVTVMTRLRAELDTAEALREPDRPEAAQRLAPFLQQRQSEYRQVMAAYQRVASLAGVVLAARNGADDAEAPAGARSGALVRTFEDEVSDLLRNLCHLTACYLLSTSFGTRGAITVLRRWGFDCSEESPPHPLTWHEGVGLAMLIALYMLTAFYFVFHGDGRVESFRYVVVAVFIGLTMALAVFCAGVPRLLARGRGARASNSLDFGYYLVAGCLAAVAWCVLFYVRMMLTQDASIEYVLSHERHMFPFMLMPAAAAFMIALLIDLDLRQFLQSAWLGRIAEGLALGVTLALAGYIVADLIGSLAPETRMRPDPGVVSAVQLGLGLIIGYLVPHLYRQAVLREEPTEEDAAADEARHDAATRAQTAPSGA